MSKHNNVNPNFYKVGGREHSEGSDKGESSTPPRLSKSGKKVQQEQVLPGQKAKPPKR
jgi:hypothetical protein